MAKVSYVNGAYVLHSDAMVHIEDRGYQFSDGIYEYCAFYNGVLLDEDLHWARLERSLKELHMAAPMSRAALNIVVQELIEQNGKRDGGLYLQVTRGVAKRDHPFPMRVKPALTMTVCAPKYPKPSEIQDGVRVVTHPDHRWARRDIKSISLLANVIAKQTANAKGLREAWLVMDNGQISEGSVSNAYIINAKGELITHHLDHHILGGVTRDVVLKLARKARIIVHERAFNLQEIKSAQEAFITSTSVNVLPVVKVDDIVIGKGKPGPVTKKLLQLYYDHILEQTGKRFA